MALWFQATKAGVYPIPYTELYGFGHTGMMGRVVLVFGAATVKALLVALYYMHLRFEPRLVYALALVTLVLFGILRLVLCPELASR